MILSLLGAVVVIFAQTGSLQNVEQALDALRDGESLAGRVSPALATAAASRIGPEVEVVELGRLTQIAIAGLAYRDLASRLAVVLREGESAPAGEAAVLLLTSFPERRRPLAFAAVVDCAPKLVALARDLPLTEARAALALAVPTLSTGEAVTFLEDCEDPSSPERANVLLAELAEHPRPAELYAALAELETVVPGSEGSLWTLLITLVDRDPAADALALSLAEGGNLGAAGAILRSLGATRPASFAKAEEILLGFIYTAGDDLEAVPASLLSAAILAAGELYSHELLPYLPSFVLHGNGSNVRVAAARALGFIGFNDAPTIDLLIGLLGDPDGAVARAAWESLQRRTRQKLPMRAEMWQQWRGPQALPSSPPSDWAERLEKERNIRGRLAESERRRRGRSR